MNLPPSYRVLLNGGNESVSTITPVTSTTNATTSQLHQKTTPQKIMATNELIGVKPPSFSWDEPDLPHAFKRFKRYCEILLKTSTYAEKPGDQLVNYILLWLGPQGLEIFDSWTMSDEDRKTPAKVWDKFSEYFEPKTNYRLNRYQMRNIKQEEGEPVDSFIRRLKTHSQKCNYNAEQLEDHLIDQFIVGVSHSQVRKKILDQDPAKLSLDNCIQFARTYEATDKQLTHYTEAQAPSVVASIKQRKHTQHRPQHKQQRSHSSKDKPCNYCAGPNHNRNSCPAKDAQCNFCHKSGHWEKACMSKQRKSSTTHRPNGEKQSRRKVHEISTEQEELEEDFVKLNFSSISTSTDSSEAYASIEIKYTEKRDANLHGKIDTGSQGNILPLRTYKKMYPDNNKPLQPSKTTLTAYNGTPIKQHGSIQLQCKYKNKTASCEFFIADTDASVIFGLPLCLELGLVNLNYSITAQQTAPKITSTKQLQDEYPEQFTGLGRLPGTYKLHLKPDSTPKIHAPRRTPIQLRDQIKAELKRMIDLDVIKAVTTPTEWVSSLTYVMKTNGSIRMCLDPSDLNKALKRGRHHIPTMEELSYKFSGAKYFSKLDARSGYWSIVLDEPSQLLTTFNTPFGRYCFKRLPFGLSVSQDLFQAAMDDGLKDLPGVVSIADDIAVVGATEEEHDTNLRKLMERAQTIKLVFNPDKCQIKQSEIPFFGNIYTANGVMPDPKKVQAINDLKTPSSRSEIQSFLGLITYLAPYIPNLSSHTEPLRILMKENTPFQWQHEQEKSFEDLKQLICKANALTYFNPTKPTILQVDASQSALGAALIQGDKIVAYASKSLTETEGRYANIEREMLACVFGAERFHTYIFGQHFQIQSDHKPLETITKKPLTSAPARLQRMLLRLQRYDYEMVYRPGKEMVLADSLSRLPSTADHTEIDLNTQVCLIQFSNPRLDEIRNETKKDEVLSQILQYVLEGFPEHKHQMLPETRTFWNFRDQITIDNGILLNGHRVIIPASLKKSFLNDIHAGHLGVTKCQQRARTSIYWPNINKDIEQLVQYCDTCQQHQVTQPREQLMPVSSELPNIPWHTLSTDLFVFNGESYLIIADYMTKYPIVEKLGQSTTSQTIANITSKYLSLFGVPHSIISDNGPQFIGNPYKNLMEKLKITHVTSSPHHPQSHGFIERTIRTVKSMMRKETQNTDQALLILRTTPIGNNLPSPAELMFGRKISSNLPIRVKSPDHDGLREHREKSSKEQSEKGGRAYTELEIDQPVYYQDVAKKSWHPGVIIGHGPQPRSYTLQCSQTKQMLRRNRCMIKPRKTETQQVPSPDFMLDVMLDVVPTPEPQHTPEDPIQPIPAPVPTPESQSTQKDPIPTTPAPNTSPAGTPQNELPTKATKPPTRNKQPPTRRKQQQKPPDEEPKTTRSGRTTRPPRRFIEDPDT